MLLFGRDEAFRELCEEYEACVGASQRLDAARPEQGAMQREYVALRLRLEGELLRYLRRVRNMTNEAFRAGRKKPKEDIVYRKLAVLTSFTALMATGAWAQDPRVEIGAVVGWTLSDGVTGDAVRGGDGNVYNSIEPKDSVLVRPRRRASSSTTTSRSGVSSASRRARC